MRLIDCPDCEGQGQVNIGGYSDFGRGPEPYEQLINCEYCDSGKIQQEDEECFSGQ